MATFGETTEILGVVSSHNYVIKDDGSELVICRILGRTLISTHALVWQWVAPPPKLVGVFMLVARTYRVCASSGLEFIKDESVIGNDP
jgi:hypothetical protein